MRDKHSVLHYRYSIDIYNKVYSTFRGLRVPGDAARARGDTRRGLTQARPREANLFAVASN